MIMTRTCTYRNLYYDSERTSKEGKGQWVALSSDGSFQPCLTLLRGYYHWSPTVVKRFPERAVASLQAGPQVVVECRCARVVVERPHASPECRCALLVHASSSVLSRVCSVLFCSVLFCFLAPAPRVVCLASSFVAVGRWARAL